MAMVKIGNLHVGEKIAKIKAAQLEEALKSYHKIRVTLCPSGGSLDLYAESDAVKTEAELLSVVAHLLTVHALNNALRDFPVGLLGYELAEENA